MSQLPTYKIDESALTRLEQALADCGATMSCTNAKYLQRDKVTMYQDWEVEAKDGIRLLMCGKHPAIRPTDDNTLELMLGSPDGRRGLELLRHTEDLIVQLGGRKII